MEKQKAIIDYVPERYNIDPQLQLAIDHGEFSHAYSGYPLSTMRLYLSPDLAEKISLGMEDFPAGPWLVPALHEPQPSDESEMSSSADMLVNTDIKGRPLHPWFMQMAVNKNVGVLVGKGFFYRWGANYTVDSLIMRNNQILLIKRKDSQRWALPGGFIDKNETALEAAKRETYEESGLIIPEGSKSSVIYTGPVVDPRMTANAWPETTAFAFDNIDVDIELKAGDDAIEAKWFKLETAIELALHGSHAYLLGMYCFS